MSDDESNSQTCTNSDVDMEPDGDVPTEPRLVHFKCEHDPRWDYKGIADSLFIPDQKILVVGEKWKSNPHVHFQGYTRDAPRTVANKLTELAKRHASRDPSHINYRGPKSRPMSQGRGTVTVTGFQYMNKEPFSAHNPIYSNKFTQEELEALQAASAEHVEKKKTKVRDLLAEKLTAEDFQCDTKALLAKAGSYVNEMLLAEDRSMSKHTLIDIVDSCRRHPLCPRALSDRLLFTRL